MLVLIMGGVGMLIGAALKNTEAGEKIEETLKDALETMKDIKQNLPNP